ncbi:MAG TPA: hypothetical protein VFT48_06095, partial [Pyrinomonadaceae bacterium]|nr:hypothetical protein [Pyrinomonadaceae bacterium]
GGHEIRFNGRRAYPFRFLLKHYPVRSQAHGEKKIFRERKARWFPKERAGGWHTHYDHIYDGHSFVRQIGDLKLFNESGFAQLSVNNGPGMIDYASEHIKALRLQPDKVLNLVNVMLRKRQETVQSLAVELRKRRWGGRYAGDELETKRAALNRFTHELAERDKKIQTLLDQVAKGQDAVDALAAELAETHKIVVTVVDQLADRQDVVVGSNRESLSRYPSMLYKKLKYAFLVPVRLLERTLRPR